MQLNQQSLAITLLRLTMGTMFLAHGLLKLLVFTPAGTASFFQSLGLPGFLAYLVMAAEIAGGILIIIGYRTRLVAWALTPILIGATWAHVGNGWVFSSPNGGWEYPVFLTLAGVILALLGSGSIALDNRR